MQLRNVLSAMLLLVPASLAQETGPSTSSAPPSPVTVKQKGKFLGPISIGFRVRGFPLGLLPTSIVTRSETNPTREWAFTTSSSTAHVSFGGSIEISLARRLVLAAELLRTRVGYTTDKQVYVGDDISTTSNDERKLTSWNEVTKATWWDLPVMFRYQGIRSEGWGSRAYISAGAVVRTTRDIRTTNKVTNPDATTATDNNSTHPGKNKILGGVVGFGFRFIDDFNIKVTPEARYTRWTGTLFNADSRNSRRDQVEVGIGLTF